MDRLPEEITANIISHLVGDRSGDREGGLTRPSHSLAPFAAVSRQWQQRVEALTFAHITLTPARLASPLAAQALTHERIRRFVRSIHLEVILPPYDVEAWGRYENDAERAEANAIFTEVVRKVFALLSSSSSPPPPPAVQGTDDRTGENEHMGQQQDVGADTATGHRAKIIFSMKARSLSDTENIEWRQHQFTGRPPDIFEGRYQSSYLDLRPAAGKSVQGEAEALPELPLISQFKVDAGIVRSSWRRAPQSGHRYFAPRALCLMASRMTGLKAIWWNLCDNEKWDVMLRKRLRADFASALPTLSASLKDFSLYYERSLPSNHSYQPPSILDETDRNNDRLSISLHKLSQRLAAFELEADVGAEIFWPPRPELNQQQQDDDLPLWPSMHDYSIRPGAITPSGKWLYRRPADYPSYSDDDADSYVSEYSAAVRGPGDDKEDSFREELDPDAINPLLLAAARAAGRMPALRHMYFSPESPTQDILGVSYTVRRGRPSTGGIGVIDTAKLSVECHLAFHPDEDVIQTWRAAAREHVESRLEVAIQDNSEW